MTDHETTLRELADYLAKAANAFEATVGTPEPELLRQHAACLAGAEALRREREAADDPMVCQFCSFTLAECVACKVNGSLACCPECRHRAGLVAPTEPTR